MKIPLNSIYVWFFLWTTKNWHVSHGKVKLNISEQNFGRRWKTLVKTRKRNLKLMLFKEVLFTPHLSNIWLITACMLLIMKYTFRFVHMFFGSSTAVLNDSDQRHRTKLFLLEVCIDFEFLCESSHQKPFTCFYPLIRHIHLN